MRLAFLAFLATCLTAAAGTLPLTVREIALMLRSGYSVPAVEKELADRHFGEKLDDAARAQLLKAGATPELLEGIERGRFSAPEEELKKLRRNNQIEGERALVQQNTTSPATSRGGPPLVDVIAQAAKGKLVRCQNGNLVSYYDEELSRKKIYGLYFSAHWCPPCRKFTPTLITFYNQIQREHPEFEIIFVSADKTPEAMQFYMQSTGMPWPAIDYAKRPDLSALTKYAGEGIPDLVIVDSSGKVLLDSYAGGKYVGPATVLAQLESLLGGRTISGLAAR